MTANYLATTLQKEALATLASLDSSSDGYYLHAPFVINVRSDGNGFKEEISSSLIAIIDYKWRAGRLQYVSQIGIPGRNYAIKQLREHQSLLNRQTQQKIADVALEWQAERRRRLAEVGKHNFASGIGIILPCSGAKLDFDIHYIFPNMPKL